jgi:uncharacterized membrane protein
MSLEGFISTMYSWVATLTLAAATLAFAIAAIMYLTSSGSPDKIKKAQNYFTTAVIALAIVGFASTFFTFLRGIPSGAEGPFDIFIFMRNSLDQVTKAILPLGLVAGGLMITYAGILYMTSSGDPTKQQKAMKALSTAITGIIIIVLFWALRGFILSYLEYNANIGKTTLKL